MTTTPLIASRAFAATPIAYIDVVMAWMTAAPTIAANRENRPPAPSAVPPMTTARIASSSRFRPMLFASDVRMFELATRPGDTGAQPAEHVGEELHALLVHATEEARAGVDPDRLDEHAERRLAGQEPGHDEHDRDDEERDRQDGPAVTEERERLVEDLDPDAVGDQLGDAAARDHQDQRRDHRLDATVGDEDPVPEPAQGRHGQGDHEDERERDGGEVGIVGQRLVVRVDEERCDRGRDRHDGADREVDPAGGDHEGHADREEHDGRPAAEDVDDVAEEVAVDDGEREEPGVEDQVEQQDDAPGR